MPNSISVANKFLEFASLDGNSLTPMQLLKLVYIAHGWHLVIHRQPLTDDALEAWKFGPVYPELYNTIKVFGSSAISKPFSEADFTNTLTKEQVELIKQVYTDYGDLPAFQLSALTHNQNTPWSIVTDNGKEVGRFKKISDSLILDHFSELAAA